MEVSLRDTLINLGWEQFSVLSGAEICKYYCQAGLASDKNYLLITQTCDLLPFNESAEQWVEILEIKESNKSDYGSTKNGKSSKSYGLNIEGQLLQISNFKKYVIPRELLVELVPASFQLSELEKRSIRNWLANRYKRVAFPDKFVEQFGPCVNKFRGWFESFPEISTVLLNLELIEQADYEISLLLLVEAEKEDYELSDLDDFCNEFIDYVQENTNITFNNEKIGIDGYIEFEEDISVAMFRSYYAWNFDKLSNKDDSEYPVE